MIEAPVQPIIDNDLCIACGACVAACPSGAITGAYSDARGAWEVIVSDTSPCPTCDGVCGSVCPSIEPFSRGREPESRIGNVIAVHTGEDSEYSRNGVSSSGGVVRAIVASLLRRNIPVISLSGDRDAERVTYNAALMRHESDVTQMPGSIYHSVSFTSAISVLQQLDTAAAIVALPCQLEGIERYIHEVEPALQKKIHLRIGIICGWMYTDHALRNYTDTMGIEEPLIDAQYRGEDEAGKLKLETRSGIIAHERRQYSSWRQARAYLSSFSRDANRLRCRMCQNHVNVQADIAVGDAWLARNRGVKESIIVVRTERGARELKQIRQERSLRLEPGSIDDIIESQSEDLVFGDSAIRRCNVQRGKNLPAPVYRFRQEGTGDTAGSGATLAFHTEGLRRQLLRQGSRYRLYRTVHLLMRPRAYVDFLLRRFFPRRR